MFLDTRSMLEALSKRVNAGPCRVRIGTILEMPLLYANTLNDCQLNDCNLKPSCSRQHIADGPPRSAGHADTEERRTIAIVREFWPHLFFTVAALALRALNLFSGSLRPRA